MVHSHWHWLFLNPIHLLRTNPAFILKLKRDRLKQTSIARFIRNHFFLFVLLSSLSFIFRNRALTDKTSQLQQTTAFHIIICDFRFSLIQMTLTLATSASPSATSICDYLIEMIIRIYTDKHLTTKSHNTSAKNAIIIITISVRRPYII